MRFFRSPLFLLFPALLAPLAPAQIQPNTFQHIIIVVQENRTPDNLFGYWATSGGPTNCYLPKPFAGADLVNWAPAPKDGGPPCNVQQPMNNGGAFDPGHEYEDWEADYDGGAMDGFCHTISNGITTYQSCPTSQPSPYSYIQTSDVNPYYSIASTYGFANYMFQTNEGPSMVAHQFLFTGTSAPVAPNDPNNYYWDFVRDNPQGGTDPDNHSGCISQYVAPWIKPDRTPASPPLNSYECYPHDSLVTGSSCSNGVCDKYSGPPWNLTWTYYSPIDGTTAGPGYIWNAPEAIPEVCYGENDTTPAPAPCGSVNGGYEWSNHMTFYSGTTGALVPIFTDIANCRLTSISWVIPDLAWSDHPSYDAKVSPAMGPSWVADIVNAVGLSYSNSNQKCDYWGTSGAGGNVVQPTAIFIVWDDWGGFYDHIQPYAYNTGSFNQQLQEWQCGAPNSWGCGYTYGFRVPLLVVSEYTGKNVSGNVTNYISGQCGSNGCDNNTFPFQHDFGSILAFTESNFKLGQIAPPLYADANAPDLSPTNIPLSDFFGLYPVGRPFVQIQSSYDSGFFESYYLNGGTPAGPDTD
jgi:Phosphoesterase family